MNELGNRLHVVVTHRQRRHAFFGAAAANHRKKELTLLIVEHELGAEKVGTAKLTTAKIDAVAGAAGDGVERLPTFDERRITGRTLLCGEDGGTPATPLATSATWGRLSRRRLLGRRRLRGRRLLLARVGDDDGERRQCGGNESLSNRHSDGLGCRSLCIAYRDAVAAASRRRMTPESTVLPSASRV